MTKPFIIDGVCHPYNFAPENLQGRFGRIFNDVMNSYHPVVNPVFLERQVWERDWQPEEFIETMLLESDTDMCGVHSTPIFDAYADGLVSNDKGHYLKDKYPERVIWYGAVDLFADPQKALAVAEEQIEKGCDGIKLYPSRYVEGFTENWRMDSRDIAFPLFELCERKGIQNVAVHKVLPLGPISSEGMQVDDISAAANNFPDLNFQIVHAGFMFVDETKMLIGNHPNVYVTMEASMLFCILDPEEQARLFTEFLRYGGAEKIIYASAAVNPHPQVVIQALMSFQMPEGNPFQLTDEVRTLIMGGNLARLHGIDVESRRTALSDDVFAREKAAKGLRSAWSTIGHAKAA